MPADTQWGMLEAFKDCGFRVNPLIRRCHTVEDVLKFYRDMEEKRAELGYDIDGVVYKVDDLEIAGTARLRVALAALGHRAQIPRRAGRDDSGRHRHPGRPHRQAHAGRAR